MNGIIYDNEIITPEKSKNKYYRTFTGKLNHRDCVKLALFCAKYVNFNIKNNTICIELVEKWLKNEKSVSKQDLWDAANNTPYTTNASNVTAYAAYTAASNATAYAAVYTAANAANAVVDTASVNVVYDKINNINKYLQILLRNTKQFRNNKILDQISKTDVDTLELVDWNMITDIIQEEYNVIHEFEYEDIFSRRCLIELLRREYT